MGHRDWLEHGFDRGGLNCSADWIWRSRTKNVQRINRIIMESNDLSFLPEDFRDRNMRYRLTAAAIAVLAVFAVATATAFHVAERSLQHVKRHNAEVTRAFTRAVLRGERSAAIRNENEKLVERARRICLLASGIPTSKILADLTKAVPPTLA